MTDETHNDATLPDDLVSALRRADRPPATITSRVDHALAGLATDQFAERPGRRRIDGAWYAAAASVLGVALILQLQPANEATDLLYTDVDGSGQIDIADVLALASAEDNPYSEAELDAFAMRVVALGDES